MMSDETITAGDASKGWLAQCLDVYRNASVLADKLQPLALLAARLLVARVFFLSGLTKWDGLRIRDDAFYLFADEYFGKYALPETATNLFTVMSAVAEIALPCLLVAGLFTRFAAIGLLVMTAVIQFFVYPDAWWNVHAWWMTLLALIVAVGPGALCADRLIGVERRASR